MVKSTKPKSSTSYKDTAFGILPREKIVILERKGLKKAQEYIIKVNSKKTEITPKLILDMHREGFGFIFPKWAGKFRTIDVAVGEYEPPRYSRVPELVRILCDDLTERLKHLPSSQNEEAFLGEIISLLAWFQHRLVWIHPFQDYNGRIARLLTNLLLLNLGFPILTIKANTGQDRNRYIKAMKAADQHNFSKLEDIIAKALEENLRKI